VLSLVAPAFATTVHAGDSLYVTVWNHPELSKQVTVDADGGVRVPLSGLVDVGGLDETTAAKKIGDALRPYVQYPAVNVEDTLQGTSLFVTGGPVGVLKYMPGETLQAAISDLMQSTGQPGATQALNDLGQSTTKYNDVNSALRSRIDLHAVKVERDNKPVGIFDSVAFSAQGESGPLLEPGDRIVFRYKPIAVRVLGDVGQPGPVYLSPDQTLSEAVSQAGGLLPTSSSNHVLLERGGETYSLALGDPMFTQPAMAGDVITIPEAPRVNVVGMVSTPGVVSLKTDSTLLSALYTAGGPVKFADLRNVSIVHGSSKTSYNVTALTHGDMSQNPVLKDGDTVVVPRNNAIDFSPFFNLLGGIAVGLTNRVPL
jgi:polysaccharide export outer membrane protein